MTIRTHVQKNNTVWEWEETKELVEWIESQNTTQIKVQDKKELNKLAD
jgi:hypothetical protein